MIHNSLHVLLFNALFTLNFYITSGCPHENLADAKAAYKSGDIQDMSAPITLDKIKERLRQSEIFDWQDPTLTNMEKKELGKLFDAVEIMTTSRNRQPSNVQSIFSSLRLVERVVKKQLKEGQISETLANKFHWEKLFFTIIAVQATLHYAGSVRIDKDFLSATRQKRQNKPLYYLDKTTNMRVFDTKS